MGGETLLINIAMFFCLLTEFNIHDYINVKIYISTEKWVGRQTYLSVLI